MILCDTNILIEFYRGNAEIISELQAIGLANLSVSAVTSGELYYGARDKRELEIMKKHLSLLNQIPLDADISNQFLSLLETYALKVIGLSVPDALIAATGFWLEKSLSYTLNLRDFQFILHR